MKPTVRHSSLHGGCWIGQNSAGEERRYRDWWFALAWALMATFLLTLTSCSLAAQSLPDAPSASAYGVPRDEQITWWTLTAIDVGAMAFDAAVSSHAHYRPGPGRCHETNRFYGPYPSSGRLWAQMSAETAGLTALTWFMKRKRQHWWAMLTFADATFHIVGAVDTAQYCF